MGERARASERVSERSKVSVGDRFESIVSRARGCLGGQPDNYGGYASAERSERAQDRRVGRGRGSCTECDTGKSTEFQTLGPRRQKYTRTYLASASSGYSVSTPGAMVVTDSRTIGFRICSPRRRPSAGSSKLVFENWSSLISPLPSTRRRVDTQWGMHGARQTSRRVGGRRKSKGKGRMHGDPGRRRWTRSARQKGGFAADRRPGPRCVPDRECRGTAP